MDDANDRRTFLDHACGNDPSLRKRLSELLDLRTEADAFFEFQPALRANGNASGGAEENLDVDIGRCRLITRIGAGGGGVVYLAEQEQPVRRKVALKVIKLRAA